MHKESATLLSADIILNVLARVQDNLETQRAEMVMCSTIQLNFTLRCLFGLLDLFLYSDYFIPSSMVSGRQLGRVLGTDCLVWRVFILPSLLLKSLVAAIYKV